MTGCVASSKCLSTFSLDQALVTSHEPNEMATTESSNSTSLCWVLTETEPPFRISTASDVWYATWQLAPDARLLMPPYF